jgi:hypothetical protein
VPSFTYAVLWPFERPFSKVVCLVDSNVDIQITDRRNVDKMTRNVDFIISVLVTPSGVRCRVTDKVGAPRIQKGSPSLRLIGVDVAKLWWSFESPS